MEYKASYPSAPVAPSPLNSVSSLQSMPIGVIAGIVVGVVVIASLAAFIAIHLRRARKTESKDLLKENMRNLFKQRLIQNKNKLKAPRPAASHPAAFDIEANMPVATESAPAAPPRLFLGEAAFKVVTTSTTPASPTLPLSHTARSMETPFAAPEFQHQVVVPALSYGPKREDKSKAIAWIQKRLKKIKGWNGSKKDLSPRDCPA